MALTDEIERRLNIWQALSELFLDTEIDGATYQYIARTVVGSGYSRSTVKYILWQEVFPVLESNLREVAGVWEGYSRDWLRKNLRIAAKTLPPFSSADIINEINFCWERACKFLPSEYA
jgi:hypothetical protein